MKNRDYWKRRMEILQKAQLKKGQNYLVDLDKQYRITMKNIERELAYWYERFAVNNQLSMTEARKLLSTKELKEFHWTVEEYIKYGRENALNQKWMEELENASARVHVSRLQALKLQLQQQVEVLYGNQTDDLDRLLRDIYTDGYYHTAYEIQKGFNVGWDLHSLNQKQLDKILSKPWSTDGRTFSDRIWTNKQQLLGTLQSKLTQSVIRGEEPRKAIAEIANQFNVDRKKAGRLVMTESAAFASIAQKDCFNELGVEKFEIVATLDQRTSDICQDLDGEVFDMKDYEVGVTAPPFHPWCRTVTAPWFEDNYGERAARDQEGNVYYVPSNMKYHEWKKKFVDGGDKKELKVIKINDLKSKIEKIKERINKKGTVTKKDLDEAGGLIFEDLKGKRLKYKREIEELQEKIKNTGIYDLKEKSRQLFNTRDELLEKWRKSLSLDENETILKNLNEVNKELNEVVAKMTKIKPTLRDLENELELVKLNYEGVIWDNAEELKNKLSEIRAMGNASLDIDAHLEHSRSPMRKIVKKAYDYCPTEWVQQSAYAGTLTPKKVSTRGYYKHWKREIAISGDIDQNCFKTAIHELGHRFERVVPGILEIEKEFYEKRTAGETLKWLGPGYAKDEKTRRDKFINEYMGKDYDGVAYELVSMGLEYAFCDPTTLWQDEEYAKWIYGILALL